MKSALVLVSMLASGHASVAVGNEAITDAQWGETRCDLVAPEHRTPCMDAHSRLGIPSDKTTAAMSSTATPAEAPISATEPEIAEITRAKKIVTDHMKDPTSVLFKDVVFLKEKQSVCGSVNAKNSYGAYSGFAQFVVGPSGVIHTFDGSTTCYGEDKYACLNQKLVDMYAVKENCSSATTDIPDDPQAVLARVDELGEDDGAMAWVLQENVMAWIERNQASEDREVVKALVYLCDLMSNRGSRAYMSRLEVVEKSAANKKVRSECRSARKAVKNLG